MMKERRVVPPMLFLVQARHHYTTPGSVHSSISSMAAVIRATPVVSATITMYCVNFLLLIIVSLIEVITSPRSAE